MKPTIEQTTNFHNRPLPGRCIRRISHDAMETYTCQCSTPINTIDWQRLARRCGGGVELLTHKSRSSGQCAAHSGRNDDGIGMVAPVTGRIALVYRKSGGGGILASLARWELPFHHR